MRMKRISLADMERKPPVPSDKLPALPVYTADLLQELDRLFPHRCIGGEQSYTEAHRYAAKRELIDYLLARQEASRPDPEAPLHVPG